MIYDVDACRRDVKGSGRGRVEGEGGELDRLAGRMGEEMRRLIEWWEQQYCASRMTLAVVGKGKS